MKTAVILKSMQAAVIEDAKIKKLLVKKILPSHLKDNVKARELQPDGTYILRTPKGKKPRRSQMEFIRKTKSDEKEGNRETKFKMGRTAETTRLS